MSEPARILVLSEDPARGRELADGLSTLSAEVWVGADQRIDGTDLDVIVTDHPLDEHSLGRHRQQLSRGEIGLIAAGTAGPADVALPADFTRRELRLACRLLTEIVRLRRQHRNDHKARRVLSHLALSDPLTGLPNRRAWQQRLEQLAAGPTDSAGTFCLAVIDLDHFKRVNEQSGHLAGDEVLKDAAAAIAGSLRRGDFVARLGGDEFALIIHQIEPDDAAAVVERIRCSIGRRFDSSDNGPLTASAGFAVAPTGPPGTIEQVFAAADRALRRAKTEGRDRTIAAPI